MKTPIEVLINTFEVLSEKNESIELKFAIAVLKAGLDYEREYIKSKENA
tara:strand:+ start:155 stop:301 length:147 start_codon:yes stop_codon:yes gene_type:complete